MKSVTLAGIKSEGEAGWGRREEMDCGPINAPREEANLLLGGFLQHELLLHEESPPQKPGVRVRIRAGRQQLGSEVPSVGHSRGWPSVFELHGGPRVL